MKHIIYFTIAITLFTCSSRRVDSNLWEISSDSLKNKSYLFGSIHFIPKSLVHIRPVVEDILKKSDVVVFEANLDTVYNLTIKIANECLSHKEQDKLRLILRDSFKLNNNVIDSAMNLNAIQFGQLLIKLHFGELFSFDYYYYQIAKSMNKRIYYLDSYSKIIDYQRNLADELWYRNDSSRNSYLTNLNLIFNYYNLEKGASTDSFMRYDKHINDNRSMVVVRNLDWISPIDSIIKENKVLIIVGSGHLGGDCGLLNLLTNKKYNVEPI